MRNLLEKAILRQATPLMKKDPNDVTEQDIKTLLAENFSVTIQCGGKEKRVIGF